MVWEGFTQDISHRSDSCTVGGANPGWGMYQKTHTATLPALYKAETPSAIFAMSRWIRAIPVPELKKECLFDVAMRGSRKKPIPWNGEPRLVPLHLKSTVPPSVGSMRQNLKSRILSKAILHWWTMVPMDGGACRSLALVNTNPLWRKLTPALSS